MMRLRCQSNLLEVDGNQPKIWIVKSFTLLAAAARFLHVFYLVCYSLKLLHFIMEWFTGKKKRMKFI
jgi:hypothetical protein